MGGLQISGRSRERDESQGGLPKGEDDGNLVTVARSVLTDWRGSRTFGYPHAVSPLWAACFDGDSDKRECSLSWRGPTIVPHGLGPLVCASMKPCL